MSPITHFILVSLVFHLLYTASIFDIYFTSPVVHPSQRFSSIDSFIPKDKTDVAIAPAKRLILIVGDGLRADTLFGCQPGSLLPPWAAEDVLNKGKLSTQTALNPTKDWTLDSNRLVADMCFDPAPHLNNIVRKRGAWGVSHTRVPTESRPGHVALIAGMYEDVSAVTKGWKLNPVSFDSVFNQSSHTFSFGSPDILPMFAKGASPGKVDMQSYSEDQEDFTSDASNLDLWVLDRLRELLEDAKTNVTLSDQLNAPQSVIFLHLLGLDTTGHTHRPRSAEYVGNLMIVDAIVAETERLLTEFYGEEEVKNTAFVFTADHGMSHKGNHGDGEPDNTRTPLLAWGAGIRKPRSEDKKQPWRAEEREKDEYYEGWGSLDSFWREDVEQADIAPLMSTLIGANIPANSEGRLPLDYLDITKEQEARSMIANALEILEVYKVKHDQRSARMLKYIPFHKLPSEGTKSPGSQAITKIKAELAHGAFDQVIKDCDDLIRDALEGANYLQTYDWLMLISIIISGYLGSMLYGALFLLRHYVLKPEQLATLKKDHTGLPYDRVIIGSILATLWAKFAFEQSPPTYYLYAGFAAYFWIRLSDESGVFELAWAAWKYQNIQKGEKKPNTSILLTILPRAILAIAALEVMAIGYLNRFAWTAGFIFLGAIWPGFGMITDDKSRHELLVLLWLICCGVCTLFTVGSIEKEESIPFLVGSGIIFLIGGGIIIGWSTTFIEVAEQSSASKDVQQNHVNRTKSVLKIQLLVLIVSTIVTASSSASLQSKNGLPRLNQVVAWIVLAVCLTIPVIAGFQRSKTQHASQDPSQTLMIVVFAFAPLFVLLSIRDEALFFACYTMTLITWAKLEAALFEERLYKRMMEQIAEETEEESRGGVSTSNGHAINEISLSGRILEKEDVRIAICFLFFLHVGFFGTGNIASISSFYLSPVYRLIPIFSPFLMAALLILKILVPFIVLASVFQMLCLTPPNPIRCSGRKVRKTGIELAGPPIFGKESVGGLGLRDAYSLIFLACLFTDILALNFLLNVQTNGSWLEIGQSITHFAMSNLLQVFVLALSGLADLIVGRGRNYIAVNPIQRSKIEKSKV